MMRRDGKHKFVWYASTAQPVAGNIKYNISKNIFEIGSMVSVLCKLHKLGRELDLFFKYITETPTKIFDFERTKLVQILCHVTYRQKFAPLSPGSSEGVVKSLICSLILYIM